MRKYGKSHPRWSACYSLLAGISALLFGCATANPPQTVGSLNVERYMGVWYEIAKFPVFFERGLVGVTAEYALEKDGRIRVTNQGFKKDFGGEVSSIKGYATIPDPENPAKLRIRFDPFPVRLFPAGYWIIELDEEYQWAAVSNRGRKVLWILSRTPSMKPGQYQQVLDRLKQQGFDVDRLEKMPQEQELTNP